MQKHKFTIVLSRAGELTEELADLLYSAGCDDGSPGQCEGIVTIDFHREADTLEAAIRSAIADVRAAGCQVERVQMEPDAVAFAPSAIGQGHQVLK